MITLWIIYNKPSTNFSWFYLTLGRLGFTTKKGKGVCPLSIFPYGLNICLFVFFFLDCPWNQKQFNLRIYLLRKMITQLCSLQSSLNVISSPNSTECRTLSEMDAGSIFFFYKKNISELKEYYKLSLLRKLLLSNCLYATVSIKVQTAKA